MKKYFKKFSVIFIMSLILVLGCATSVFAADDGSVLGVANLNNTTQNSAKVGDQLTAPEIGWERYDDTNSMFTRTGTWNTDVNFYPESKVRPYKGTVMYTKNVDSTLSFDFTGTKLRIIAAKESYQSDKISITIDGKTEYYGDKGSLQYQTLVYQSDELDYTKHTVEIKAVSQGDWQVDAVDVMKESITLDKSSMELNQGDSRQLTATVSTTTSAQVTWTSSDPSVATVDSNGKVTAVGAGTATITATTTDGSNLSASCIVNVIANNGGNTGGTTTGASAIVNIAYAKGDNTNNAGGDVSIIFNGVPDTTLSVVKTASVKSVWVGDTFTYTIVVTNTGSKTAKAVVINDSAPNHIQFMPSGITTTQGTVDSSSSASNIVVNVGDIPPAGTVTIIVPATVVL